MSDGKGWEDKMEVMGIAKRREGKGREGMDK